MLRSWCDRLCRRVAVPHGQNGQGGLVDRERLVRGSRARVQRADMDERIVCQESGAAVTWNLGTNDVLTDGRTQNESLHFSFWDVEFIGGDRK